MLIKSYYVVLIPHREGMTQAQPKPRKCDFQKQASKSFNPS